MSDYRDQILADIGQMRVRFWSCTDHRGAPHRVEWRDDVAYCLTDGCGRNSAAPQSDDSAQEHP